MAPQPAAGRRALAAGLLAAMTVAGCASTARPAAARPPAGRPAAAGARALALLAPQAAPASWRQAKLPDGGAVMAYPPSMHLIEGDGGTVSAAQQTADGDFLSYLNATPRQGTETLANWPGYRLHHLLGDDATTARELGSAARVPFLGGTGSCVMDTYVTKAKANHYTEIACLVRGRSHENVIVAAAPVARWNATAPLLRQAIAAYRVH